MTIELNETVVTAKTIYDGDDSFVLPAGKTLTVQSTPDGNDFFEGEVPDGKSWAVTIYLKIEESTVW